jgi:hypothetical protein
MRTVRRRGMGIHGPELGCVILLLLVGLWSCHKKEPRGFRAGPTDSPASSSNGLRILYAGRPGSDREKEFVAFLREHFGVVETGNLQTFKEVDAQGFDVTILDYDADDLSAPGPTLSPLFSKPLITLGVAGGHMGRRWRLKTAYL